MKRQINFRFLGWLVVGALVIGAGTHFLHAFQIKRNAHVLLEDGKRAEEKGNLEEAAGYYRNYLLFEPGDNNAWGKFGIALAKLGEKTKSRKTFEQAFFALERVLLREPELDDVRVRSIDIAMLQLGRFADADGHLDLLLRKPSSNDKPEYRADLEFKRGLCAFGQRDFPNALSWFTKAKNHAQTNLKYYTQLALLNQKYLKRSEAARDILRKMVDNVPNVEAHLERARFLVPLSPDSEVLKDARAALADAEESLKKALELAPKNADALMLWAAVNQVKSDAALGEGRRLGPIKGKAKLEEAKYLADKAREQLVTGIESNPKNVSVRLDLVFLELKQGNIDKALETAEQAHEELPEEGDVALVLADLLVEKGKIKDAQKLLAVLTKLAANQDVDPDEKLKGFNIDFLGGLPSRSAQKAGPDENLVGYLQARIYLQQQKWSEAEPILTRVRPFIRNKKLVGRLDYMVGLCYEMLGNPDQALSVYQESVQNDPTNMESRLKVAGALAALDLLKAAIQKYEQIEAFAGAPAEIDLALARLLLRDNNRLAKDARNWAEVMKYLKRAETNLAETNLPGKVEAPLLKAEALKVEAALLKAEALFQQGYEDQARALLEGKCKAQPERVELWQGLASLAGRKSPEKGLAILEDAAKEPKLKDHAGLMLGKMSLLSRLPSEDALKALSQMEKQIDSLEPAQTEQRLHSGLALAYFKAQAPKEAARIWTPIAEAQPLNLGLRLILCDLALMNKSQALMKKELALAKKEEVEAKKEEEEAKKEEKEADRWLEAIQEIEGKKNGFYWRYGKAFRLVQQVRPNEKGELSKEDESLLSRARDLLEKAEKLRPSWYAVSALEGQIDDLAGRRERAIDNFQRAEHLGDRRAGVIRRLVELLLERKRYQEAERAIRPLLDQPQTILAAGLGKLATQSLLFTNEVERALDLAKESVKSGSEDYKDHLWLSQILWSVKGQKENAIENAKKEIELACKYEPTAPETWETYIYYLTTLKEYKKAEEVLAQAAQAMKNLPAEKLSLTLAHCYTLLNKRAEAEKQFQAALGNRPDDKSLRQDLANFYIKTGQFNKAEKKLVNLMEAWDTSREQKAWARRNMAAILANKTDFRNFQKAMDLLDENHKSNLDSNADQRTRALIMARHVIYRREAIRLLEDLDRTEPLSAEDRFVLVKLYEAADNRPKFKRHMLALLTSREEKPPALYAYYIRFLLQNHELGDAQAWQKQLATLAPKSIQTLESQARILHAQGQEVEAVRLLNDFATAEPAKEENLALAVYLLDELGQTSKKNSYLAASEALHRQWAKAYPGASAFLSLAQFLGRQQRVGEALDYCERFLAKETRDAALTAAESVLRANPTAEEHFPRVEAWYKKAYQENPTVAQVALQADFYDLQKRYDEAIVLYREILQKDAENRLALNNLAWLLAMYQNDPDSLKWINKALEVVGPIPEYLDTRGVIELTLNKTKDAEDDLEKAVEMNPSAATLYHLARVQLKKQNVTRARTTYRKAKAAVPAITIEMLHPLERREYNLVTAALER